MPLHRLILVAHGETDATRQGLFPADEPLNAKGRAAAAALSGRLAAGGAVFASPSPAAQETASLAGLAATAEPALADLDLGRWRGRSFEAVAREDAAAALAWIEDGSFVGHGGESFAALIRRVGAWVATRLEAEGATVAVTHAAVVRAAVVAALGLPSSAIWRIEVAPLARLTLGSDGRRWTLRELTQSAT